MQNRRTDFARQLNEHSLGVVGDPERWGSSTDLLVPYFPVGYEAIRPGWTSQLVRGQTSNLAAVPWHLFASFEVARPPTVKATLNAAVEIQFGTGQATSRIYWPVSEQSNNTGFRSGRDVLIPATGFDVQTYGCANHLQQPLPAASIQARAFAWWQFDAEPADPPFPDATPVLVNVQICPALYLPGWDL